MAWEQLKEQKTHDVKVFDFKGGLTHKNTY